MPVWTNVVGRLEANAAWYATLGALGAFILVQATALAAAALVFLGRASDQCLVGPECGLYADTPSLIVAFSTLALLSISIGVLGALWRFTRAVWHRQAWTAVVARIVGWASLIPAILGVFVTQLALAWVIVAVWLLMAARGLRMEGPAEDPNVLEGERV